MRKNDLKDQPARTDDSSVGNRGVNYKQGKKKASYLIWPHNYNKGQAKINA